jgi:hypothetical protein
MVFNIWFGDELMLLFCSVNLLVQSDVLLPLLKGFSFDVSKWGTERVFHGGKFEDKTLRLFHKQRSA